MELSIAETKRDLCHILKQTGQAPVIVTRRGEPDAVILSFREYRLLCHLRAYLRMTRFSERLESCGVTATELYEASRRELEERL